MKEDSPSLSSDAPVSHYIATQPALSSSDPIDSNPPNPPLHFNTEPSTSDDPLSFNLPLHCNFVASAQRDTSSPATLPTPPNNVSFLQILKRYLHLIWACHEEGYKIMVESMAVDVVTECRLDSGGFLSDMLLFGIQARIAMELFRELPPSAQDQWLDRAHTVDR